MPEITRVLQRVAAGEAGADDELLALVYDELRRLAARQMSREPQGQTLQATALVHEAWLRLGGSDQPAWENRSHFFGAAAEAMRRILVDRARRRLRARHGGGQARVDADDVDIPGPMPDEELLALDRAIDRLREAEPRAADLVRLCYFLGLTQAEAADQLGISVSTAERDWAWARAWLFREIRKSE